MTTTSAADVRRARRAYLAVATWIPIAMTSVAVALMIMWLGDVPASIAVHWGPGGAPDRFGPAWSSPLLAAILGYGLAGLFAGIGAGGSRSGEWGPVLRFLGALSCGLSFFLATLITVALAVQRGLADAADAPSILIPLAIAAGAGIITGISAWFLQPAVAVSGGSAATPASALALGPGERAVWLRTATMARPAIIAIIGVTLLMAALAITSGLAGGELWWLFTALAVLFAILSATTCVFRVRVSEAGLRVTSIAGFPRFGVASADVAGVSVVNVAPVADFGGWGIRSGLDGRFGIVLRGGEAIQVARRSGGPFVVTVDDAATGAAVLSALAARETAARP
ncbi:DUF1648 domain-containing protein [Microbacterium sp. CFH 90308]|uniref:DUF1648 domain-containing protein n=1 Tax=Microbacterium salsuginis TaxID=2722803 RepID=A0ABX1KA80_9MICO|nr:DUF1648 domain-containing protein [Microbacterium sp. CFH 90308]NLP82311.1 DUF1648 domain-containing protein [Microbacterium sp. CFH 90308]